MFKVHPFHSMYRYFILHSFLWLSNVPSSGCTTFYISIHQLVDVLIVSHILAVVSNASTNIHVQVFAWTDAFNYLKYIPRNRIAESWSGDSMFRFLTNCQTAFQSGCTISHSHQQCVSPCKISTFSPTLLLSFGFEPCWWV